MTSFSDQSFSTNAFSQNAFEFAGNVAAAQASANGSATVAAQGQAVASGIQAATAAAFGSSTVAAQGAAIFEGAGSFLMREARWASYRKVEGQYIRQVSPGVFLRVDKDKPVAVVENRKAMDGLWRDDKVVASLDADEVTALKKVSVGAMRRVQETATLAALGII